MTGRRVPGPHVTAAQSRASTAVHKALREGELVRPSHCEECETGHTHGHHDDYEKPLEVRWLCPSCHFTWHGKNGPGANRGMEPCAGVDYDAMRDRTRLALSVDCTDQTVRRWLKDDSVGRRMSKALTKAAKRLGIERVEK